MVDGVADDPGLAVSGRQVGLGLAVDELLSASSVADQLLDRDGATSDVGRNQSGLGGLATKLASLERRWLARRDLPFGLSAVVLASKLPV